MHLCARTRAYTWLLLARVFPSGSFSGGRLTINFQPVAGWFCGRFCPLPISRAALSRPKQARRVAAPSAPHRPRDGAAILKFQELFSRWDSERGRGRVGPGGLSGRCRAVGGTGGPAAPAGVGHPQGLWRRRRPPASSPSRRVGVRSSGRGQAGSGAGGPGAALGAGVPRATPSCPVPCAGCNRAHGFF